MNRRRRPSAWGKTKGLSAEIGCVLGLGGVNKQVPLVGGFELPLPLEVDEGLVVDGLCGAKYAS